MADLTLCFSTHRPETLALTAEIMNGYDTIILEDPPHHHFNEVLNGDIALKDHLLELDLGYPEFSREQYALVKELHQAGKKIVQIEPYLEQLLNIQFFLAEEENSPKDIAPGTVMHAVYKAERRATGKLIDYYEAVKRNEYDTILSTMNAFAQADAARFVLRDRLRAKQILTTLNEEENTYIEAGSIHLLLYKLIKYDLPDTWSLHSRSIDRDILQILGMRGKLLSPGDTLTLRYIFGNKVDKKQWQQLCSQSVIYTKIISKNEMKNTNGDYPHTINELEAIALVSQLSTSSCKDLFQRIRSLPTEQASKEVSLFSRKQQLQLIN